MPTGLPGQDAEMMWVMVQAVSTEGSTHSTPTAQLSGMQGLSLPLDLDIHRRWVYVQIHTP